MRRVLMIVALALVVATAEKIEVTSDRFEASQKELISRFIGNVSFKTSKERLTAKEVVIYFDKKRKPIKVEAIGNVRFFIKEKDKSYEGSAKRVVFFPKRREYILYDNVRVVQQPGDKLLLADQIHIDVKNAKLMVKGKETKPVKMIFSVDEE